MMALPRDLSMPSTAICRDRMKRQGNKKTTTTIPLDEEVASISDLVSSKRSQSDMAARFCAFMPFTTPRTLST
jgi:hypothetical protein